MNKVWFIFVGCGGTFWTAGTMLSALVRKYMPDLCLFVDHDLIEVRNLERQWVTAGAETPKCELGHNLVVGERPELPMPPAQMFAGKFPHENLKVPDNVDVVLIHNVDNNESRLAARDWCRRRPGFAAMVVSGCDMTYGQVLVGGWNQRECLHDWLPGHDDVKEVGPPPDGCGQHILSNSTTGMLVGYGLDEVLDWRSRNRNGELWVPEMVPEFYWRSKRTENQGRGIVTVKTWTDLIPAAH